MFKNIVDRRNTDSAKWDELIAKTGEPDILALTVADMDFRVAPEIVKAIIESANHGIYGYTNISDNYIDLTRLWIEKQYHWKPLTDWIVFCPRIINALAQIIQNFTKERDKVLVTTPLYDPIQSIIRLNKRELITSSLVLVDDHYTIDFADFTEKLKSGVKVFVAVSPHNPTGRVWTASEIEKIVELCRANNVLLIADEVHADFIWEGAFTSFGHYFDRYDHMIIGVSASKTFNIPGIEAASVIIKNENLRENFKSWLRSAGFHNPNYFCNPAVEAAYSKGEEWLCLVKKEILQNRNYTIRYINEECAPCKVVKGEGTFLLWIDYSALKIEETELNNLLIHQAKVACSMGSDFGREGIGYFRINIAQPSALLQRALSNIKKLIKEVRNES